MHQHRKHSLATSQPQKDRQSESVSTRPRNQDQWKTPESTILTGTASDSKLGSSTSTIRLRTRTQGTWTRNLVDLTQPKTQLKVSDAKYSIEVEVETGSESGTDIQESTLSSSTSNDTGRDEWVKVDNAKPRSMLRMLSEMSEHREVFKRGGIPIPTPTPPALELRGRSRQRVVPSPNRSTNHHRRHQNRHNHHNANANSDSSTHRLPQPRKHVPIYPSDSEIEAASPNSDANIDSDTEVLPLLQKRPQPDPEDDPVIIEKDPGAESLMFKEDEDEDEVNYCVKAIAQRWKEEMEEIERDWKHVTSEEGGGHPTTESGDEDLEGTRFRGGDYGLD